MLGILKRKEYTDFSYYYHLVAKETIKMELTHIVDLEDKRKITALLVLGRTQVNG